MKDVKNFDKEKFLITLENKLGRLFVNNTYLSVNFSVNELFNKFFAIFAPIRKATRQEKNSNKIHELPIIC